MRLTEIQLFINGFCSRRAVQFRQRIAIRVANYLAFMSTIVEPIGSDETFVDNPSSSKDN